MIGVSTLPSESELSWWELSSPSRPRRQKRMNLTKILGCGTLISLIACVNSKSSPHRFLLISAIELTRRRKTREQESHSDFDLFRKFTIVTSYHDNLVAAYIVDVADSRVRSALSTVNGDRVCAVMLSHVYGSAGYIFNRTV